MRCDRGPSEFPPMFLHVLLKALLHGHCLGKAHHALSATRKISLDVKTISISAEEQTLVPRQVFCQPKVAEECQSKGNQLKPPSCRSNYLVFSTRSAAQDKFIGS